MLIEPSSLPEISYPAVTILHFPRPHNNWGRKGNKLVVKLLLEKIMFIRYVDTNKIR